MRVASSSRSTQTSRLFMSRTVTTACPHCGLHLVIHITGAEQRIEYDVKQWEELCKRRDLTSPGMCLELKGSQLPS